MKKWRPKSGLWAQEDLLCDAISDRRAPVKLQPNHLYNCAKFGP